MQNEEGADKENIVNGGNLDVSSQDLLDMVERKNI